MKSIPHFGWLALSIVLCFGCLDSRVAAQTKKGTGKTSSKTRQQKKTQGKPTKNKSPSAQNLSRDYYKKNKFKDSKSPQPLSLSGDPNQYEVVKTKSKIELYIKIGGKSLPHGTWYTYQGDTLRTKTTYWQGEKQEKAIYWSNQKPKSKARYSKGQIKSYEHYLEKGPISFRYDYSDPNTRVKTSYFGDGTEDIKIQGKWVRITRKNGFREFVRDGTHITYSKSGKIRSTQKWVRGKLEK